MRKDGLYEIKVRDRDGRRKSLYSKTKEGVLEKAREYDFEQDTLYGYFAQVFVPSIRHLAYGSKRVYAAAFDRVWIPELGKRELSKITRADIQRVVNRMAFSSGTVSQYLSKLTSVLDLAVSDGLIGANPARFVRTPKVVSIGSEPIKAWELKSLLESVDREWNLVVLCGFFGLRIGEACGILVTDLDDCVNVERQWPSEPLKTSCSLRRLPIPESCEFRITGVNLVGTSPQTARSWLDSLGFTPHSLRKTFMTILEWELGCPRSVSTRLMGHSDGVAGIYSKADLQVMRDWLERYWEHVSTSFYDSGVSYLGGRDRLA